MSRHSTSPVEILLSIIGTGVALLIAGGVWIWRKARDAQREQTHDH